jgi:hypothetical protein
VVLGIVCVAAAAVVGAGPRAMALLDEADAVREALGQHPEWEEAQLERAELCLELGDVRRATEDLEAVLERRTLAASHVRGLAWALDARLSAGLGCRSRAERSLLEAEAVRERLGAGDAGRLATRIRAARSALDR